MGSVPSTITNSSQGNTNDFNFKGHRTLNDGSVTQLTSQAGDFGYNAISTATTTVVKTGAGQLRQIMVIGGTLGAITVYDNTAASGTVIVPTFTPPTLTGPFTITLDISFTTGLTVLTAAATAVVVTYR